MDWHVCSSTAMSSAEKCHWQFGHGTCIHRAAHQLVVSANSDQLLNGKNLNKTHCRWYGRR